MTLRLLEERCRRFIELMQEGSVAIERQDAIALRSVSAASRELLAQIERAWHLTLSAGDVQGEGAEWARLRELLAEAMDQSAQNQRRVCQRNSSIGAAIRIGPPQGTA